MADRTQAAVELEGYEEIEVLGESAAAILLRARPEGTATSVVIKLLRSEHPTPEEVARLAHEHRIVEDLHLDGVVRPLRIDRFKHRVGLILEDSGGSSLRSMIGPTGLDTETFLRVAIPLVRTLGHLHDADVIHKDLNPSNIVVDDTLSTVQITDFGIASRLPARASGRPPRRSPGGDPPLSRPRTDRAHEPGVSITAPTSTPSAPRSTKPSPGGPRSRPPTPWSWSTATSPSGRRRREKSTPPFPKRWPTSS